MVNMRETPLEPAWSPMKKGIEARRFNETENNAPGV